MDTLRAATPKPIYLQTLGDLQKYSHKNLGSMELGTYKGFIERMFQAVERTTITQPRIAIGMQFKQPSLLSTKAWSISGPEWSNLETAEARWKELQDRVNNFCIQNPNVYVFDGEKYSL